MAVRYMSLVAYLLWFVAAAGAQDRVSPFAQPEKLSAELTAFRQAVERAAMGADAEAQPADMDGVAELATVPPLETQQAVLKKIDDIFGRPMQPKEMLELAAELLKTGREDRVPANRYGQFRRAGELAIAAGDAKLAAAVVDLLEAEFALDALAVKAAIAEQLVARADHATLLDFTEEQFDEALAADHLAAARRLGAVGYKTAVAARDKDQIKAMRQRAATLAKRQEAFAAVKEALTALGGEPDDPAANLQLGEYLAFHKGDWLRGLPLLAKGGHTVAKTEQAVGDDPDAQCKLADAWWELAASKSGPAAEQVRARALEWYRRALPNLSGFTKLKVQKRLADIAQADSRAGGNRSSDRRDNLTKWLPLDDNGYLTQCLRLGPYPRSAVDDRLVLVYLSKGDFDDELLGTKPAPVKSSGHGDGVKDGQQVFVGPAKAQSDHVMYYLFRIKCDKDQIVHLRADTFTRWNHSTVAVGLDFQPTTNNVKIPLTKGTHTIVARQHHKKSDREGRSWVSVSVGGEGIHQAATVMSDNQ